MSTTAYIVLGLGLAAVIGLLYAAAFWQKVENLNPDEPEWLK